MAIQAGFASVSITPRIGATLAGYAARRGGSQGLHDHLCAHVAIVADSSRQVVIINLDLLEVSVELVAELRRSVQEISRIPAENVLVSATHTHSGPMVTEWFGESEEPGTIAKIISGSVQAV